MKILINVLQLLAYRAGYIIIAGLIIRIIGQNISGPRLANYPEKSWRWFFILKNLNYLIIIGFVLLVLQRPFWVWLQLSMKLIPALLLEDLADLLFLGGYILFSLRQMYLIDYKRGVHFGSFRSYIKQYAYSWLLLINILVFLRMDYYYLPLIPGNISWLQQTIIEIVMVMVFVGLQFLVIWFRKLKMVKAYPELQAMVKEIAGAFKIKIKNIRVWQLERVSNAFSTGIFLHSIFLTENLVRAAKPEDLRMIIGHECAHFKRRHLEIRVLFIGVIVYLLSTLAEDYPRVHWPVYAILALLSFLGYKFLARQQELNADRLSAKVLGGPSKMAGALIRVFGLNSAPLKFEWFVGLLASHPDMQTRVEHLMKMRN